MRCSACVVASCFLGSHAMRRRAGDVAELPARVSSLAAPADKLAMVHIPCNFGHTVERVALNIPHDEHFAEAEAEVLGTFSAPTVQGQWDHLLSATGPDPQIWGMMYPELRVDSEVTGCEMYYTPQELWPDDLAAQYFGNSTVFGMLRNPYDKLVNEFRMQVGGWSSLFLNQTRADVSMREGSSEREKEPYTTWYRTCDVNAWVKAELAKYKEGDRFRGNCHLLPQEEYFRGKYAIELAIDVAKLPHSFNTAMEEHGSPARMLDEEILHNVDCNITAWSLDEEATALIQEVYAEDFALTCKHNGVCGTDMKECCCNISDMCDDAPAGHCESKSK